VRIGTLVLQVVVGRDGGATRPLLKPGMVSPQRRAPVAPPCTKHTHAEWTLYGVTSVGGADLGPKYDQDITGAAAMSLQSVIDSSFHKHKRGSYAK